MKKALVLILIFSSFILYKFNPEIQNFAINVQKYENRNEGKNHFLVAAGLNVVGFTASLYPQQHNMSVIEIDEHYNRIAAEVSLTVSLENYTYVTNAKELQAAIENAEPGSVIVIAAGEHHLTEGTLQVIRSGTLELPISIIGQAGNLTTLLVNSQVGVNVNASNITIQNITFKGLCDFDSNCEHAIHIFGDADGVSLLGNKFVNFNAHVKINGNLNSKNPGFPDFGLVKNNVFINEWQRDTRNPVTPFDLVAGSVWRVEQNFFADFAKSKGDRLSYGAFFKGGGQDSVFINNVLACEWKLPHKSFLDTRVGLSVGGGGTGEAYKRHGECRSEYCNVQISGNLITNCQNDAGIYLNKAEKVSLTSNTLRATMGIQTKVIEEEQND